MVWAAIGAILHGLGSVGSRIWDATRDFVSWLFSVMPGPLKFFVFLYIIVFLLSSIMPIFLGAANSCDSYGNAYKISFVELQNRRNYVENMAEICSGDYDSEITFDSFLESAGNPLSVWQRTLLTFQRAWGIWTSWRTESFDTLDPICHEFNQLNITNETVTKDAALQVWGEKLDQEGYENIVHIGCSQSRSGEYFPSLLFYNVDLFKFEMWLLLGMFGALIPFAFKWYNQIIK